ncbi:MAG: tetratricopeptide repeat protein [Betaproteobacteria bacterium]|nr:tetratricopeptide repeat protein [Betaproteobacteria bacterium]
MVLAQAQERLSAGEYAAAADLYRRVAEASPAQAAAWNGLAFALNGLEDFPAAEAALRQGLAVQPQHALLRASLAVSLMRQQHHAEAETAARAALALEERVPEAHLALAESLAARGELAQAETHYLRSAELDETLLLCRNVRLAPAFFDDLALEALPQDPAFALAPPADGRYDHVVLIAADPVYFERFGGSFFNSFAENAGANGLLHVHLVGAEPAWVERIRRLAGRLGVTAYCVSAEPAPADQEQKMRRVFYACARFLHLPRWLAQYNRPIVCLDIDAVVREPARALLEALAGHDLGLVWHDSPYSPWTRVLAGTLAASPTGAAIRYLDAVARYIGYFLRTRQAYWSLDQIALYCTLRHLQERGAAPDFAKVNDVAEGIAWQLTRKLGAKDRDALYARYRVPV